MTLNDFNTKWKSHLMDGFYGLDINDKKVIAYLDEEFEIEIKFNPHFTYKQIKIKMGFCRIYATTSKVKEWETKVNLLIKNNI